MCPGGYILPLETKTSRPTPESQRKEAMFFKSLGHWEGSKWGRSYPVSQPYSSVLGTQHYIMAIDLGVFWVLEDGTPSSQAIISKCQVSNS